MLEQRQYQTDTINEALQHFSNGKSKVMIESPTGSGKTIMALLTCKKQQPASVVWVAMRRHLLNQAAMENQKVGVENIHFVSMFDRDVQRLRQLPRPIMFVVDEGHHDSANSMVNIYNVVEPEYALGLTATPYRTDKVKLIFDAVVRASSIHRLVRLGYLSQYNHYVIEKWTPAEVAKTYIERPEYWGQSTAYFLRWEQVLQFQEIIKSHEQEIREKLGRDVENVIEVISGNSSGREDILERFRTGKTAMLANCMVLTEGFDAPTMETVFVRDSSRGPTTQMAGRVFRKHPDRKVKKIVQSKFTKYPAPRITKPLEQWVKTSEWQSITHNDQVQKESEMMMRKLLTIEVALPRFIEQHKKRRRFGETE